MSKASIILGLQWGDEGKGLVTDYLCSQHPKSIAIRFSGGPQAGHTVVLNGKRHIHSSFASGALRGMPSYFTEHTCIYIPNLIREWRVLQSMGVDPTLYIHPMAKVILPGDIAWNRAHGDNKSHGTCGLGIAATMRRNEAGYTLTALEALRHPKIASEKVRIIHDYYLTKAKKELETDWTLFLIHLQEALDDYTGLLKTTPNLPIGIEDYDMLHGFQNLVFEGSQGIMLDASHGIFPHVTYANTTSKNAIEVCQRLNVPLEIYYVTRCYQTRHGNGWMSNSDPIELINNEHETNVTNEYQGDFRTGELDYDMLNYALDADSLYSKGFPKNLVVTCMDQRSVGVNADKIKAKFEKKFICYGPSAENLMPVIPQRMKAPHPRLRYLH